MPIIHAIVLGLVQGLSEFLPISSSGHLLLVPWMFGWHDFDNTSIEKAFDVALHLGTLIAVVAYFWKELVVYVREGVRLVVRREKPGSPEGRLAWLLVLSALPAGAVGAVAEKTIDNKLGT
ncbi:MAG: undecaprenyl-diphosphatase, partial [Actinomycetota bacterium]